MVFSNPLKTWYSIQSPSPVYLFCHLFFFLQRLSNLSTKTLRTVSVGAKGWSCMVTCLSGVKEMGYIKYGYHLFCSSLACLKDQILKITQLSPHPLLRKKKLGISRNIKEFQNFRLYHGFVFDTDSFNSKIILGNETYLSKDLICF